MRSFLAPEVVQTSSMDCGPASLKCLLEGWGIHVSYGRLREACQTGIDGTSIDTMEAVANQLGLEAEQIMVPVDHVLLRATEALPSIIVLKLPSGLTHFVVAWRRHGNTIQLMDPAVGRRWSSATQFIEDLYIHSMSVAASDWNTYARSDDFQSALRERMKGAGLSFESAAESLKTASEGDSWKGLAELDAGVRFLDSLRRAGGVSNPSECARVLKRFLENPESIPDRYWSVRPSRNEDEEEQVVMRGAVLVRTKGSRTAVRSETLTPELAAAIEEKPVRPGRELAKFLWQSGPAAAGIISFALAVGAGAVILEALLFRSLFDVTADLTLRGQRLGAMIAILLFGVVLFLMELSTFSGAARMGRQLEAWLRVAFLSKIPRLTDRYFQSRLTSDMAERCHATHRLRHLSELGRQMLRTLFQLLATAAGIIWLEPSAAPFIFLITGAAVLPIFTTQPLLAERDLRVRSHAAGLTRFYLDAMLGLQAIRAHAAQRSVRKEHEKLLGEWANAALALQKTVATTEAVQLFAMFGLVACLLLLHPLQALDIGRVLLVVYWTLNLPVLGQDAGALARQYPYFRNLTLRLLDPLGAKEEEQADTATRLPVQVSAACEIEFRGVKVQAAGQTILEDIDLRVEPGSHVAIVGPSGAGKSSFVSVLLGWLKPGEGNVLVNGAPLIPEQLRKTTAWVDPAVQLWNRSLFANISYGSQSNPAEVGRAIDNALLRTVLESLPQGLQTKLGEGGGLVSGGEGQRVRLARAMLRPEARLVILDEPFRGLDREKRRELLARARDFWRDCTILCITHDLAETQAFDNVIVIEQGRIAEQGAPGQLSTQPESRYARLLEAERQARSGLWAATFWRRIRMQSGRVVEEVPRVAEERLRGSEVA